MQARLHRIQSRGAEWPQRASAKTSVYLLLPPTRHDLTHGQKARKPIKVGIKGRGSSGTSHDSNLADLCCSSAHLVQCEPDEASSFTNPNVGPGTYAGLWLE